jgi:hypothetical protein
LIGLRLLISYILFSLWDEARKRFFGQRGERKDSPPLDTPVYTGTRDRPPPLPSPPHFQTKLIKYSICCYFAFFFVKINLYSKYTQKKKKNFFPKEILMSKLFMKKLYTIPLNVRLASDNNF